eukprot:GDKJ01005401.1.p1 GENE.GDKJ01005401.1~~GDKJ01005401.1.p1  ORF type:complete len:519 (-),score=107.93 GDKJ01005401.1:83-1639(-)
MDRADLIAEMCKNKLGYWWQHSDATSGKHHIESILKKRQRDLLSNNSSFCFWKRKNKAHDKHVMDVVGPRFKNGNFFVKGNDPSGGIAPSYVHDPQGITVSLQENFSSNELDGVGKKIRHILAGRLLRVPLLSAGLCLICTTFACWVSFYIIYQRLLIYTTEVSNIISVQTAFLNANNLMFVLASASLAIKSTLPTGAVLPLAEFEKPITSLTLASTMTGLEVYDRLNSEIDFIQSQVSDLLQKRQGATTFTRRLTHRKDLVFSSPPSYLRDNVLTLCSDLSFAPHDPLVSMLIKSKNKSAASVSRMRKATGCSIVYDDELSSKGLFAGMEQWLSNARSFVKHFGPLGSFDASMAASGSITPFDPSLLWTISNSHHGISTQWSALRFSVARTEINQVVDGILNWGTGALVGVNTLVVLTCLIILVKLLPQSGKQQLIMAIIAAKLSTASVLIKQKEKSKKFKTDPHINADTWIDHEKSMGSTSLLKAISTRYFDYQQGVWVRKAILDIGQAYFDGQLK